MKELGDLIYGERPKSLKVWLSQMEVAFNDLWESVDNYMGNPPLPPFKQFQKNLLYLTISREGRPPTSGNS